MEKTVYIFILLLIFVDTKENAKNDKSKTFKNLWKIIF